MTYAAVSADYADAEIYAEIQAAAADSEESHNNTAVDSSDIRGDISTMVKRYG